VRIVLLLLLLLLGFVAALPSLVSLPAFHRQFTERLTANIAGTLTLERLFLRWRAAPQMDGLQFSAPDGRPVLLVDECRCERSLFALLTDRTSFGKLRLVRPTLHLLIDERGNNIADAVRPKTETEFLRERVEDLKKLNEKAAGNVHIEDGHFVFQSGPDRPTVELADFNVRLAVLPADQSGASRRLVLQPGDVFRDIQLTRDLCNDLIKYAAPVLARNTWVQGSVSLTTGGGTFPADDLAQATMTGQLTVHEITAGPGPIVTEIARALEIVDEIRLVDQSVIEFELANQHVRHQGLRFEIGRLAVETAGSVGFDETVELVATIVFPAATEGTGELARRLAGRKIQVPIGGTIGDPRIDWAAVLEDHPFLDQLIERVLDPDDTPVLDVLRDLRQRRRQRLESGQSGPLDRPLGRRLLQNLLNNDNQAAPALRRETGDVSVDDQ
jgi:hypothetical protein